MDEYEPLLAGQPFDSEPVLHIQQRQYDTQLDRLRDREAARGAEAGSVVGRCRLTPG